MTQIKLISAD